MRKSSKKSSKNQDTAIQDTVMQNLTPFPPFDYEIDKLNAGPRWEKWIGRLENLFVGLNLKDKGEARKRALLLHYAGETVYDIYEA